MRHAIMIILLFVVLAIFDLAVLEQDKGARLWAQLTGQSVAKEDDLDVSDVEPAQDVAPTDAEVEAMVSRGKALAGSDAAGDRQEAANLFRTAAKHDSSEAMFRLGRLYMKGVGVEQNDAAAVTWLTDAANAADPSLTAMLWLGKLDRESNPKQAVAWFKRVLENAGEGDQIARVKAEKQLERLLAKHKDLGQ
jgi:TPR repeat protein